MIYSIQPVRLRILDAKLIQPTRRRRATAGERNMKLSRRQFLQSTAALFCAPAIVKAENIMSIWTPPQSIEVAHRENLADLIHDVWPHETPILARAFKEGFELVDVSKTADCIRKNLILHVKDGPTGPAGKAYISPDGGPRILLKHLSISARCARHEQNAREVWLIRAKAKELVSDLMYQRGQWDTSNPEQTRRIRDRLVQSYWQASFERVKK